MGSQFTPRGYDICTNILAPPVHSPVLLARATRFLVSAFEKMGIRNHRIPPTPVSNSLDLDLDRKCRGHLLFVLSGGTEHVILDVLETIGDMPAVVVAHPLANSLPSLLEVMPLLHGFRAAGHYIPGLDPRDPEALRRFEQAIRGLWAASRIIGSRILMIGPPSPWLVYSRPRPESLSKLSIEVKSIEPSEFAEKVLNARPPLRLGEKILNSGEVLELAEGEPERSLKVYQALKDLVTERSADAATPACWWFYKMTGANACLAHALLNDEGIIVGCEGDVPATITMMLASLVSGKPAFFANPAQVSENKVLLAHCTAPLSLGLRYRVRRHFITGGSMTFSLWFPEGGRVTLMRIDPYLERLRIGVGTIVDGKPSREFQCESQMLIHIEGASKILDESIGNHYIAVMGDHVASAKIAASILGLRLDLIGA